MKLRTLVTDNYRNLIQNPPEFSSGLNILCGSNAAGKTNTLEAIYLFAAGKSFRTKSDRDFIRHGESYARAEIVYDTAQSRGKSMSINFLAAGQSTVKGMCVEGFRVERASEFLGNFRAVLFTPDHLELVKGAPEERRRLVDMALCQIKPGFVKALNEYGKVLAQRNNYLKNAKIRAQKADTDYLDVLNRLLASAGAVVTKQRGLYCEYLDRISSEIYGTITSDAERLKVDYVSRVRVENMSDEKECAEALYKMYVQTLGKDIETGRTSCGPHRDELMIYISKESDGADNAVSRLKNSVMQSPEEDGEKEMTSFAARTFGSQGQQRSAVLAIKMAEGEIVKERCSEYPVFLLDDLFSELDSERKHKLCSMLEGRQCVVTACDKASIPAMADMNIINVKNGRYQTEGC